MKFVFFNKFIQIKKGNREGTKLFTHNINPSFAARYVLFEKIIMHTIIPRSMQVKKCFLKLTTLKFESFGINK